MTHLIHDIEAFCAQQKMSPWQFGILALNDKPFVKQVKEGRRVWPDTEAKVRQFMATYSAPSQPSPRSTQTEAAA